MKYSRHSKILEIIDQHVVETQDDLAERLRQEGMDVTQATVSRDIKELRLVKVMTDKGESRYTSITQNEGDISDKLLRVFTDAFISCDYANNIVVVKTLPGMAQAAASAVDSLRGHEIIGTIGGDDTLLIVCKAELIAKKLVERFNLLAAKG